MNSTILPLNPEDREWVRELIRREWGDEKVIVHQEIYYPHKLPGYKAIEGDTVNGLITYEIRSEECEIISLNSFRPGEGIGSALILAVEKAVKSAGCSTCKLVTTNNNLNALGFYQKRGYFISRVDAGAVNESRKIKPSIPIIDENGIPIRDEILLIKCLSECQA
jgi:ribosomal protein S18 acetylase RimI-like enzyme